VPLPHLAPDPIDTAWLPSLGRTLRRIAGAGATDDTLDRTSTSPAELTPAQCRGFAEHGYLILRGFFDRPRVDQVRAQLDDLWATRPAAMQVAVDAYLGQARERRYDFRTAPAIVRASPYKLNDLHEHMSALQSLATDARLLAAIDDLLSSQPVLMNSLLLEHGSQQAPHFDTFHMPSRTPNMMAAAWLAIDPATPTNGPLIYYPGSHRVPPYRFSDGSIKQIDAERDRAGRHVARLIARHRWQPVAFLADPGDVLIWHAQLLHGGSAITVPGETRLSAVIHYWTTADVTRPEDRIDLGGGRLLLRKSPPEITDPDALDLFLEGLRPAPADRAAVPRDFDARRYLLAHPDLFALRVDPYWHYAAHGRAEGRRW
jgi:ectoine hydroxylase-related dioxygenase (phytanoyl-CoA dioxygenase family)